MSDLSSKQGAVLSDEVLHREHDRGWVLPEPAPREIIHTRSIVVRSFRRADGLFDLDGRFIDTRPFEYDSEWRGVVPAGSALHQMQVRMTLDSKRQIQALVSAMPNTPYRTCSEVNAHFQRLVGVSVGRGFRKALQERLASVEGCTHVTALLVAMAAAAVQTFSSNFHAPRPAGEAMPLRRFNLDALLDTCYSYREGGELVTRIRSRQDPAKPVD